MPAGDRRPKHGLRIRLDRVIERQVDVLPVASRARADGVDRVAQRVLDDRLAASPPGQGPVETELEAGQPAIVDTGVPEHLRRDRVLRIEPSLLGIEAESGKPALGELRSPGWVRFSLDVDESVRAIGDERVELLRIEAQIMRSRDRHDPGIVNLQRIDEDRGRLLAQGQLHARPIEDRAPPRRQRHRLAVLARRHGAERLRLHALEPGRTQERRAEGDHEQG